eukprot:scaffold2114_cov253-Pinguiococcus_pyrenoidosus.AAC.36
MKVGLPRSVVPYFLDRSLTAVRLSFLASLDRQHVAAKSCREARTRFSSPLCFANSEAAALRVDSDVQDHNPLVSAGSAD